RSELAGQHLGAETDAEERLLLAQRDFDPFDLGADEVIGIIGAHGAAENHRSAMPGEGLGQRIAESRPPYVHRYTAGLKVMADPSRRRCLLVQNDQNRLLCRIGTVHGASRTAFFSTRSEFL